MAQVSARERIAAIEARLANWNINGEWVWQKDRFAPGDPDAPDTRIAPEEAASVIDAVWLLARLKRAEELLLDSHTLIGCLANASLVPGERVMQERIMTFLDGAEEESNG